RFRPVEPSDPVAYVLSLNLHRRHLTPSQLSMVGARARTWYDEQARERQREAASRAGKASGSSRRGEANVPVNLPERSSGDARDQVAQIVGVSGKSIDHATWVLAQGTPALIAAVDANLIAVSTAARVIDLPREEQDAVVNLARENASKGHRKKLMPTA